MALSVGQPAPDFTLPALSRRDDQYRLSSYRGKIVVIAFWSPTCSTCRRYIPYLDGFAEIYRSRGVQLLAITSHLWDTPEKVEAIFRRRRPRFPILRDADGTVARQFGTEITPTVYVVDEQGVLRYWGAIDDRDPANGWSDVNYLQEAVEALLLGEEVAVPHVPPSGRQLVLASRREQPSHLLPRALTPLPA